MFTRAVPGGTSGPHPGRSQLAHTWVTHDRAMRRRWKWLVGALVVVVVLAVAVPFIYIHFIEGPAPAKLVLPTTNSTSTAGASGAGSSAPGLPVLTGPTRWERVLRQGTG